LFNPARGKYELLMLHQAVLETVHVKGGRVSGEWAPLEAGVGGEVQNISKEQGVHWRVLADVLTFPRGVKD